MQVKDSLKTHKTFQSEEAKMVIDPICLMELDEKSASTKTVYNGQTFYFCDEGCKRKFEEDPEQYIDIEERGER
ncbi:MAG: YHS domain-containing protein [Candidatus Zixiibacteriota bacterium]